MTRFSHREFPPYKFLPGKAPHPEKEGGYMRNQYLDPMPVTNENYFEHELYLYALDLFNYAYYWESHVYWEHLWNLAKRAGSVAETLKALIKLAAAGVKMKLGQTEAAYGHLERAIELFQSVPLPQIGISAEDLYPLLDKDTFKHMKSMPPLTLQAK